MSQFEWGKGFEMPWGCIMSKSSIASLMILLGVSGVLGLASASQAEDAPQCATVPQASGVIDGSTSRKRLIELIAQTVPSDPSACVPSYCAASLGKPEEVRMAVGAGLAEAFARLSASDEDAAQQINNLACSLSCDEVVAKSYATGRAETLERICDASYDGGGGGVAPSLFQINAGGGGGGAGDNGGSPN